MDLFYQSFQSLLNRSSKDIQFEDLISPPDDLHAEQLYQSFVKIWNEKKNLPVGRVPILWTVLHKLIFNQFWYAGFCRLVSDVLVLIGPILIELVVRSAQNSDRQGVFWYSTYLFISSFFQVSFSPILILIQYRLYSFSNLLRPVFFVEPK